jgi:hypothetical protein
MLLDAITGTDSWLVLRTLVLEPQLGQAFKRIKSDGDFSRPATERRKRHGASPSKEGIRPVGAKTTLVLPELSKASFQTGGNDVFARRFVCSFWKLSNADT